MNTRNWYFGAFIIFSILFVVSALIWFGSISPVPDYEFVPGEDEITAASIALATAVFSLIGTVLTLFLTVRQERREQKRAEIALELQRLEIEKERLALERLKRELKQEKDVDT